MKYAIHKYLLLPHSGVYEVEIPTNSTFLSVQQQFNKIALWFRVGIPIVDIKKVKFHVFLTGQDIMSPVYMFPFLGTVQFDSGDFVLHVFQEN